MNKQEILDLIEEERKNIDRIILQNETRLMGMGDGEGAYIEKAVLDAMRWTANATLNNIKKRVSESELDSKSEQ